MKNKLYILLVMALAFTFSTSSCSDFLDEENKVGETADLTYSTSSGIQGLVSSCYSFARDGMAKKQAWDFRKWAPICFTTVMIISRNR